jgi:FkbM family methyltransferase
MFQYREWALCPDLLPGNQRNVYSFGIGDTIDFERVLIERFGAEVHGFDPTPSVGPLLKTMKVPAGFHFYPWALADHDETLELYPRLRRDETSSSGMYTLVGEAGAVSRGLTVTAKRLSTIMADLAHDAIDVLKMDIEGAEYRVFSDLLQSEIRPTQILVECHHRFEAIGKDKTRAVVQQLARTGYRVAFVSLYGREVTFAQDQSRAGD